MARSTSSSSATIDQLSGCPAESPGSAGLARRNDGGQKGAGEGVRMPSTDGERSLGMGSAHTRRLAVALVGCGVLLLLLAALPRLQTISGRFLGAELALGLLPPSPSVSDQVLVRPIAGGPGAGHDLRGAAPSGSGFSGFGQAIKGGPAAFVTINLEDGRAWLSSRLYIFLQALREVRGIEAVVFTERTEQIDQFAGVAGVDDVVARLEWAYPLVRGGVRQSLAGRASTPCAPPESRIHQLTGAGPVG
jgi:hypothetical protein